MAEKKLKTRIQHKHDIEANWTTAGENGFKPLLGELIIYDTDEFHSARRIKIGDGVTTVNLLPFAVDAVLLNSYEITLGTSIYNDGIKHVYSANDPSGGVFPLYMNSSGAFAAPLTENIYFFNNIPADGLTIRIYNTVMEPTASGSYVSNTFSPVIEVTDCIKDNYSIANTVGGKSFNYSYAEDQDPYFNYTIYPPKDVNTNQYTTKAKVTIEVNGSFLFIKNELFFMPPRI